MDVPISKETCRETLRWNGRWAIPFLLVVAFALRLWVALTAQGIARDGIAYVQVARGFVRGDVLDALRGYSLFHWAPFYPFLIASLSSVIPDLELAGRLVSAAAGTLLVLAGYILGRRIFGTDVGLLSAFFLAIHPRLLHYGGSVLTESTYLVLVTAAVERGWAAIEGRRGAPALAAGLLSGLAYLTRPEGVGIPLLLGGWILWCATRGPGRRELLAVLGALMAAFIPFFAPYILFVYSTTGTWMLSGKFGVAPAEWIPLGGSLLVLLVIMELSRRWLLRKKHAVFWVLGGLVILILSLEMFGFQKEPWPQLVLVREGPLAFFRALGKSLLWEAKRFPEALTLAPFLLFLMGGLCRSAVRSRPQAETYLRTIILFYLGVFALFRPSRRFLVQLVPYLLPWAGVGLLELQERARPWLNRRYGPSRAGGLAKGGMAALLLVIALTHAPFVLQLGQLRAAEKEIGLRLRPLVRPDTLVMADRPQVAFYAGATFHPEPGGPFAAALAYARSHGVQYWLIKMASVPEWEGELEAAERRGDLVGIDTAGNVKGEQFIMFRLVGITRDSLETRH